MNTINVYGPITVMIPNYNLEAQMSELSDQVNALVAEDGLVIGALNDLAAKVAAGTATAADAQAAKDTIAGEVSKLQAAVATDDPPPADVPVVDPAPPAPVVDMPAPDQPADSGPVADGPVPA